MSEFTRPVHGQLTTDAHGDLICHECYKPCRRLDMHIQRKHKMEPEAYRKAHGLEEDQSLIALATTKQMMRMAHRRARTPAGRAQLKRATARSPIIPQKPTPPQS